MDPRPHPPGGSRGVEEGALSATVTRCAEMWFVQGLFESDFDTGVDQLTSLCINALQLKDKARQSRPAQISG